MSNPGPQTTQPDQEHHVPDYTLGARGKKVRRVPLALFLCALSACILVSILGFVCAGIVGALIGAAGLGLGSQSGFMEGVQIAFMLSAMNWFLFFITIPAAWIALGFSIGRMPHRNITRPAPYLRWAAIWGAVLVGTTATIFAGFSGVLSAFGGLVGGGAIGSLAGLGCGAIFLAIVKPRQQIGNLSVDVF